MKKTVPTLVALAALALSLVALYRSSSPTQKAEPANVFAKHKEEPKEDVEIADFMSAIQTFHLKTYLAAKAGNDKLTQFYLNEMGEKMLTLARLNIWSNGVNISENMKTYGLKQIDAMLAMKATEIFTNFDALTNACNSCHTASKHADVKIKTPVDAVFFNQDFNP